MSWEEVFRKEYPCPCGKGTYTTVHRSDDWGQYESNDYMNCDVCLDAFEKKKLAKKMPRDLSKVPTDERF